MRRLCLGILNVTLILGHCFLDFFFLNMLCLSKSVFLELFCIVSRVRKQIQVDRH